VCIKHTVVCNLTATKQFALYSRTTVCYIDMVVFNFSGTLFFFKWALTDTFGIYLTRACVQCNQVIPFFPESKYRCPFISLDRFDFFIFQSNVY
jgi:hypothetical protein